MTMAEHFSKHRRLCMLRWMHEAPGYSLNESLMQDALEEFGHAASRDLVRGELDWLKEQGLVSVEVLSGRFMIATLTQRGVDVATGRATHTGVKRPSPREV